ncbi:DUF6119 family protein [Chondromyces crocatus]|uniref:TIGR04141 family sporadically distributed protein n=1 Tax=Chondromyces crocatus TaxID=52 RepID=A0A0K1EKX2_CHOCO|nr:DUF6119 family protein [Chondromyces crocatus]AKT41525.1 uncharacterized protein CMC5_057320 [Chondromyces crocatus]
MPTGGVATGTRAYLPGEAFMPRSSIKTATLPIYLLKERFRSGEAALRRTGMSRDVIPDIGTLYTDSHHPYPPGWLSFFEGTVAPNPKLLNASTGGVLFVEVRGRLFAITFGRGRGLLAKDCWEEGFGLRVTLNSIDAAKIKSIDHKTFEAITRHSRTQTSREGSTEDFGLDIERDLVRAVTGEPKIETLGRRLTGMDSLVVTGKFGLKSVPALLEHTLDRHALDDYKENFGWIDNISEVRDGQRRDELDAKLVARLKRKDVNRLWLSPPDILDWSYVGGFKYKPSEKETHSDLSVADFLESVRDPGALHPGFLRSRRILAVDADGEQFIEEWPVYQCIYCEEDIGSDTYLLSTGKWYRIEKDFANEVNRDIKGLASTRTPLPPYKRTDTDEATYNERVARQSSGALALMDRKIIHHGGKRSSIEFCDLFSSAREIICVKRYEGSSAPLSHLFFQALASAELWRRDAEFRKKVNRLLPRSHKISDSAKVPDATQYPIVFAIVSHQAGPILETLPFFSRLALRNIAKRLALMGYPVSVLKIDRQ